jgi:hypothetical protein
MGACDKPCSFFIVEIPEIIDLARQNRTIAETSVLGHGDIRGVLVPESANNAKEGGALIPTLLFGIPPWNGLLSNIRPEPHHRLPINSQLQTIRILATTRQNLIRLSVNKLTIK